MHSNKINEGNPNGDSTQKPGEEPAASTPTNAADASGSGDDSNWDEIMSGDTDKHINKDGSGHEASHGDKTEEHKATSKKGYRAMQRTKLLSFRNLATGNRQENSKHPHAAAATSYRQQKTKE